MQTKRPAPSFTAPRTGWSLMFLQMRWSEAFIYFKHEDTPEGALYAEKLLEISGQALSQP